MASIIYSHTGDSYVKLRDTSSWANAQGSDITDGDVQVSNATYYDYGVLAKVAGSRGSANYDCHRSYFQFDLSGESGTVDSAVISIRMDSLGSSGDAAKAIMVGAAALDDGVEDHGNVFSSGTTWHDDISDIVTVSITAGYHVFTMNSDGITLIQNAVSSWVVVTVGLVSWKYDYVGTAPYANGDYSQFQVAYSEFLGTSLDPKMEITYEQADNATFFGANF